MLFSRKSSQKHQTQKVIYIIWTLLLRHIDIQTNEFMNDEFDQMYWKKYGEDTITTKW